MRDKKNNARLLSFIERVETLEEEKSAIADDIKAVKAEAKASGFDVKTINKILRIRKMDKEKWAEEQHLLDLYLNELGMLKDTPLGAAAVEKFKTKNSTDIDPTL